MTTDSDTRASRTRAAADILAARAHDTATAVDDTHAETGDVIRAARTARLAAVDLIDQAVLYERARGATWDQVAAALSLDPTFVREHWGQIEDGVRAHGHAVDRDTTGNPLRVVK